MFLLTYLLTYYDNNLYLRALASQPLQHVPSSTSNNIFFSSLLSRTVFMTADYTWFPIPFITLKSTKIVLVVAPPQTSQGKLMALFSSPSCLERGNPSMFFTL